MPKSKRTRSSSKPPIQHTALMNLWDKKSLGAWLQKYFWCIVILLALLVRFWKIEYIPYANDADELAYIWAGQSLTEFGMPVSWSSFEHAATQWYWLEVPSDVFSDQYVMRVKFVKPWFDHSFVLPIIMGTWSHLLGYSFPEIPPAVWYRLPFLVLAGINLTLVYQIAKKVFGNLPALFALSLLSFSPMFLLAQRMVVSENLLTTFLLLTIYFFFTERPLWSVILATGLAGLVKLPGLFVLPIITFALLAQRKYKSAALYFVAVSLFVLVGYLGYGALIDLPNFLAAMRDQSSRLLGWSNPAFIFSHPGFHTKAVLDLSYYLILFLGLLIFFVPQTKETKLLSLLTLASLFTIWMTSAEQDMLGWYKIPLFSLLAINSAAIFSFNLQTVEKSKKKALTIPLFIPVLVTLTLINNMGVVRFPESPFPEAQLLRMIVLGLLGVTLLFTYLESLKKFLPWILIAVMTLYAGQSFYIVDQYFEANCKDRTCPTPTVTLRQKVKDLFKLTFQ